jgi:hypothetical protein
VFFTSAKPAFPIPFTVAPHKPQCCNIGAKIGFQTDHQPHPFVGLEIQYSVFSNPIALGALSLNDRAVL